MDKIDPKVEARLLSPLTLEADYGFLDLLGADSGRTWFTALAGREHCRPDYRVERTRYPFHVLELITGGQGWAELDGNRFELRPGTFFRTRPEMRVHLESSSKAPIQKVFFCIGGRGAERRLFASGIAPGCRLVQPDFAMVRDLALVLIREARGTVNVSSSTCRYLMEAVLAKLGASAQGDSGSEAERARLNFERCREHIDAEEGRARSLREIAAEVGLEPASVCRLFRRFLGVSPYQYLLRRRMERAAAFLLSGRGLVKEAAAHAGMNDPFHFSRLFQKVHGVSPSRLLEACPARGRQ